MGDVAEGATVHADCMAKMAQIVCAFVANNPISPTDLPKLIVETHKALQSLLHGAAAPVQHKLEPAVSIKKSVTPEFIICLDDGKKFQSMKRHLARLGMTPDEYRLKWGLPSDYPMVASKYAAVRSALAKSSGLGRNSAKQTAAPAKNNDNNSAV